MSTFEIYYRNNVCKIKKYLKFTICSERTIADTSRDLYFTCDQYDM